MYCAKKLPNVISKNAIVNLLRCYRRIKFFTIFTTLLDIFNCWDRKRGVKFAETGIRGLGFKLVINCKCESKLIRSSPYINTGFEINHRIFFVMRLLGVGREGLNFFYNCMNSSSRIAVAAIFI